MIAVDHVPARELPVTLESRFTVAGPGVSAGAAEFARLSATVTAAAIMVRRTGGPWAGSSSGGPALPVAAAGLAAASGLCTPAPAQGRPGRRRGRR